MTLRPSTQRFMNCAAGGPLPSHEELRLQTLNSLGVLDGTADPVLDGLVRCAAALLDCPIVMVTLVSKDHRWIKASVGVEATATPREEAFCAHALDADDLLEVCDAAADPRFASLPWVLGAPHARFYAGAPLRVDGHAVGTLCIVDREPRRLTAAQRARLADLARAVEHWMLSRREREQPRASLPSDRDALEQPGAVLASEPLPAGATPDCHRLHLEERVQQRTAELEHARHVAEAANAAKTAFLASMSHEIRTPMNGVIGIVDVLRQSSLTGYQSDLAETIRESAFALLEIIDDILDFSKIEANRLTLEYEPVALLRLVEGVCDALQPVAEAGGVSLETFVDPLLPAWVLTDPVRLRQILNNLLGNAIKFCGARGQPGRVWMRVEAAGDTQVKLVVSDNGIGMAAEAQARIFEPFVQAEGTTTRRYGGTGLGLSICRRLVHLFGGTIGVQSEPGRGATFNVCLPVAATAGPAALPAPHDLRGLQCLIVSPDARQAADWAAYFSYAGARPIVCADLAALQHAFAAHPAAIAVAHVDSDAQALAWLQHGASTGPLVTVGRNAQRERRRSACLVGAGRVSLDAAMLHRDALLHAVAMAAGRASPVADTSLQVQSADSMSVPDVEAAAAEGRLILVAEDNKINQKVIRHQLALLGLAVEVADDGLDALDRWRAAAGRRYGLLLTDVHMPRMDGYQLVAAIRVEEPAGRRLPIVALTANAMRDEADRCLAIGMDDCLSKPVQLTQLADTLGRWLPAAAAVTALPAARTGPARLPVYDSAALAALIGDDADMLAEVRGEFIESAQAAAAELRLAARQRDQRGLVAVAHRLKSSARTVGALALGDCCERLEALAPDPSAVNANVLLARFDALLEDTVAAMSTPGGTVLAATALPPVAGVLLVDDDALHSRLIGQQLATLGVAPVQTFGSGAQVLWWLRGCDSSAFLMLVDLNMPEMDGVELIRHLADQGYAGALALLSGADVRVLETASKLAAAYGLNVLHHVRKPVPPAALLDLVDRWRGFTPARASRHAKAYEPQAIAHAIEAGELVLHYQPKVALSDGAWVGVEALLRWQHPTDGLVYPDSFIAVAEAHQLIDGLTHAVLTQALAQTRKWHDAGLALKVAVNISMDNLANLDFPKRLMQALARYGVPPEALMLEVSESKLMQDTRTPMDVLTRLRLRHIGLSIDDFGAGHSSLAQLRDIPFDELKIDRGFVHGSREQPTQRAIYTASVKMAHQLGMTAVAEGVEDRADWDFVRESGCNSAQGYFIARPMTADALPEWAAQWRQRLEAM